VTSAQALAADAVSTVLPEAGRRVIAAAVTVSAFGVMNAQFLTGPRLTYAMARDGRFFRLFAGVSPRFATPVAAIVLLAAIATTLILIAGRKGVDGIDPLTAWVVVMDGLFFALSALTLVVFHRRGESRFSRRFLAVPIVFAALEFAAIWGALTNPRDASVRNASFTGLLWVVGAGICYAIFFRKRRTV
jgi:basic amino acid/polyamine antiporter, APA family